ncbi:hypothetical protein [Priestia megaterium]|uniref:hypothetical protein n=1 Tax=Priestia megaterium TaxID=1404 RepID=UPI002DB8410B|nr:hypothetical protein [Priestia megaterium]MEC1071398.1 hypothetical protein [Priestia megaterium]
MSKMDAEQMISLMKDMKNGERIKFLDYLFHNHFGVKPLDDMIIATTNYVEDQLDKTLNEEETQILKLAYESGYGEGSKAGIEKVLKGSN